MEDKDTVISVNLIIADRPYPLKIKRSEESKLRSAAKLINDKIKEFQLSFGGKDKQDFLAMATLQFVMETMKNQSEPISLDSTVLSTIDEIADILNKTLQ